MSGLYTTLDNVVKRDPEQEVRGMAVPVLDKALSELKDLLAGDPVVAAIQDVISPEAVAEGEPIRAVDALMVVTILQAQIPPPSPRRPFVA